MLSTEPRLHFARELAVRQARALELTPEQTTLVYRELCLCDHLDQVRVLPRGGCIAWLRCRPEQFPLFTAGDEAAVSALPVEDLRGGPVLFVVEILAPEPWSAYRAIRMLSRLPGVRTIAGYRMDGSLHMKRVRSCPG